MGSFKLNALIENSQPNDYYRLDIVRSVSFENAHDSSMPFQSLIVNFSRYSDKYQSLDQIKNIPAKDIFKSKQIDTTANLSINVDVTNLIFLKPGTVWKNGSPVWESSELTGVEINQDQATIVSGYHESKLGTQMPFIYRGNGVQFLKFPESKVNGRTVTVLVPTTEVIRYYFSGSTYFTRELFNGALRHFKETRLANRLFFKYEHDPENEAVYIWLKRHCYDSDAFMICRGLADDVAMNAMGYIYASLVYAKKHFNAKDKMVSEACPRTNLPFSGDTSLEVLGQWLPPREGEEEFSTYMVRTIEDCDYPLPFKKITIESLDSYKSSGMVDETTETKPTNPTRKRRNDNKDGDQKPPNLTDGERPTDKIEPEELKFMMQRFSHLKDVQVEKVEKVSDNEKQKYYQQEKESESDKGSTLPGDYRDDNNLQAWRNSIVDSEPIPTSQRLVRVSNAVATVLEKESSWSVEVLPIGRVDETLPFGLCSFERPAKKSGHYTWDLVGNRSRRALFLAISNQSVQTVYLLEIEGKGDQNYSLFLFRSEQHGYLGHSSGARSLMLEIADSSGAKIKQEVLKEFLVIPMKHTESDNDPFEERLHRAIGGVFEEGKGD